VLPRLPVAAAAGDYEIAKGAAMPKPITADTNVEPIERASLDELRALQLDRLRWSVRHAYANVAHYKAAFDAASRVKHLIGIRIGVEVNEPHTIERSAGKMRRIVDYRESL